MHNRLIVRVCRRYLVIYRADAWHGAGREDLPTPQCVLAVVGDKVRERHTGDTFNSH
jgi:hypothetical protein